MCVCARAHSHSKTPHPPSRDGGPQPPSTRGHGQRGGRGWRGKKPFVLPLLFSLSNFCPLFIKPGRNRPLTCKTLAFKPCGWETMVLTNFDPTWLAACQPWSIHIINLFVYLFLLSSLLSSPPSLHRNDITRPSSPSSLFHHRDLAHWPPPYRSPWPPQPSPPPIKFLPATHLDSSLFLTTTPIFSSYLLS